MKRKLLRASELLWTIQRRDGSAVSVGNRTTILRLALRSQVSSHLIPRIRISIPNNMFTQSVRDVERER